VIEEEWIVFKDMTWFNEPPEWNIKDNSLVVKTRDKTDFWRKTFYGFIRDDGHFLYKNVKGDFTAQVTFIGNYKELYDQAGLMLRGDELYWVKTGIEFTDKEIHLSAVFTREVSDWSVMNLTNYTGKLTLRLTRHGSAIRIQYLDEKNTWRLIRLGYLELPEECQVGIMCCSPQRAGFEVEFRDFTVAEPISTKLHED
jgi:regulation of enolase protein 1 (concanavalin A-like superfamily)